MSKAAATEFAYMYNERASEVRRPAMQTKEYFSEAALITSHAEKLSSKINIV